MKQKNNEWNVPESYFLENKSRLLHHTEWEVEENYFVNNKAKLLRSQSWKVSRTWSTLAAAACVMGIGLFIGWKFQSELSIQTPPPLASLQTAPVITPNESSRPVEISNNTSKPIITHTNPTIKALVKTDSVKSPENFEQALASISRDEIIDYLAEEDDDSWFDSNTN